MWLPVSQCRQQSRILTDLKGLGTYTVPKIDVQVAATVQSVPGPMIVANYVATNAVVALSSAFLAVQILPLTVSAPDAVVLDSAPCRRVVRLRRSELA